MNEPEVLEKLPSAMTEFYADDWLFVGVMPLKAGNVCEQHVHAYDHPTVIGYGTVKVWMNGEEMEDVTGPACVTIKAGTRHRFLAVTDSLILCCHNLRGEGYPKVEG